MEAMLPFAPGLCSRRHFLRTALTISTVSLGAGCQRWAAGGASASRSGRRLFFTSQGRTGLVNLDGSGLRYLDFHQAGQVTWQPGPSFRDGRRVLVLSMEQRRDGPGRPFDEYYTQTPTHLWEYDLDRETLRELATRDRMAVFYTPALLLNDRRMLVQVVRNKVGQIFSMNLDGTDARPFTQAGEGLPYGLSASPDGQRVAFHLASPRGYEVWTAHQDGSHRIKVAGQPGHLYFGTSWSPDGQWILYQDCHDRTDPGHDWSDVCIGAADGSAHRVLTEGQSMWFAATYGPSTRRGGGSNVPAWTQDGHILYPRRIPGSRVAWQYNAGRPDTDHFNRDYKPEEARGGVYVCRLDPRTGRSEEVTPPAEGVWDFRISESPGGTHVVYCRAKTGESPAVWVRDLKRGEERCLTRGLDDSGADHPRFL